MLPKRRPPAHPGQILLYGFLEPLHLTQKSFAEHVGWTYAKVNEIIHGKRGVTAKSALTLAGAFDMEPDFWLNLQRNWELWHARQSHKYIEPLADQEPKNF